MPSGISSGGSTWARSSSWARAMAAGCRLSAGESSRASRRAISRTETMIDGGRPLWLVMGIPYLIEKQAKGDAFRRRPWLYCEGDAGRKATLSRSWGRPRPDAMRISILFSGDAASIRIENEQVSGQLCEQGRQLLQESAGGRTAPPHHGDAAVGQWLAFERDEADVGRARHRWLHRQHRQQGDADVGRDHLSQGFQAGGLEFGFLQRPGEVADIQRLVAQAVAVLQQQQALL